MANDEPKKLLHGYWFVAYLDLLGIRRAFMKTDFLPGEDAKKQKELIEALQQSVGAIRRLRSQVAAAFAAKDADQPKATFAGLPAEKLAEAERLQKARVRRDPISDGVFVACPLMPEEGHFPTRGVWDGITACITLMLANLAEGRALRGGLDVATAIEVDDELFGAAIVRAHELESKRADYPRLAVGEGLVNYLRASSNAPGPELDRALERQMAPDMLGMFPEKGLRRPLDRGLRGARRTQDLPRPGAHPSRRRKHIRAPRAREAAGRSRLGVEKALRQILPARSLPRLPFRRVTSYSMP